MIELTPIAFPFNASLKIQHLLQFTCFAVKMFETSVANIILVHDL